MKANIQIHPRKTIAILIAALGLYVTTFALPSFWEIFSSDNLFSDILFLFVFPIPSIIFAVYCFYVAWHTWKGISSAILRRIARIAALVVTAIFIPVIDILWPQLLHGKLTEITLILPLLAWGLFYCLINNLLHTRTKIPREINPQKHEKAVKIYFWLLALQVFCSILNTSQSLFLTKPGYDRSPANIAWTIAMLPISYILARITYKLGTNYFLKKSPPVEIIAEAS